MREVKAWAVFDEEDMIINGTISTISESNSRYQLACNNQIPIVMAKEMIENFGYTIKQIKITWEE